MTDTTTIPEPADGRRVVVDNGPTASEPLRLYWRDDTEAKRRSGQPGEHWFDSTDSDPLDWAEVLRYAKTVHLVDVQPITAAGPNGTVRNLVAAAIRAVEGFDPNARQLGDAICDALRGTGVRWDAKTVADVIAEMDGRDEIGDAELAHHIVAGMYERSQRVSV
jgi:hypothetical protein